MQIGLHTEAIAQVVPWAVEKETKSFRAACIRPVRWRVPVPDGSVVDLFVELERDVDVNAVHSEIRSAAQSERMSGVLEYTEEPIVSSDIIGNAHSSIFDASFTQVTGGRFVKALSWYDNEWGYSNRVCDVLRMMASA